MRRVGIILACATALLPIIALAASPAAGFQTGSLWLSQTEARSGDALKIFTVVYDSSASPMQADVEFDLDGHALTTSHVSLNAGETQLVSADWSATAGEHTFTAALKNVSGVSGALASTQTNSVALSVVAAPPSPMAQYTSVVNNVIASSSPVVQNIFQTVASTTEGWRLAGEQAVSSALAKADGASATSTASHGQVLGAQIYKAPPSGGGGASTPTQSGFFGNAWRLFLTGLLYVFQIQILFYIVLLLIIYILFKLFQAFWRERRHAA
jgi:hypothetical protein